MFKVIFLYITVLIRDNLFYSPFYDYKLSNKLLPIDNASSSNLLASCSAKNNKIRVTGFSKRQSYAAFEGAQLIGEDLTSIILYLSYFAINIIILSRYNEQDPCKRNIRHSPVSLSLSFFLELCKN